jgi:hypothetical protein
MRIFNEIASKKTEIHKFIRLYFHHN